jgi:DNA polymerase I-like protein with 3'-5' exonuclease and polymerase domains
VIVTRLNFSKVIACIQPCLKRSLDCETTGLRPYHGDRLFSLIIGCAPTHDFEGNVRPEGKAVSFYFNFQAYPGLSPARVLTNEHLEILNKEFFLDENITWFIHNAKYDMSILAQEKIELKGKVWCTKAIGRVEYNERPKYSLNALAPLVGLEKSDEVEKYVDEHKLFEFVKIPGKAKRDKRKFFNKVPYEIITPYGERDGTVGYYLGLFQENSIECQSSETKPGLPTVRNVAQNENRLTKTIFNMERVGVRIDKDYCMRAAQFEQDRTTKASEKFKTETGHDYKASAKLFAEVFASERDHWSYTDEGNPSFDNDALGKLQHHPVAQIIKELRDAKSKSDFYNGFLYHADASGDIHPNFNPDGARHGRFSSSDPNLQNLTSEEDEASLKQEFVVRRAIIPRPGFIFIMPDYDQMEYRLMLELAAGLKNPRTQNIYGETPLISLVNTGLDVHEATAQSASKFGVPITRSQAKTSNFLTIYGGGNQKLADGLKCKLSEARAIRSAIFQAAPEMLNFTETVTKVAENRKFVRNWFGRRCYFPDKRFSYRASNYIVAGGCADVVKVAMNEISDLLAPYKSRMVLTIHDELPCEIHETELFLIPKIKEIMEQVYKSQYLPLTCGMEHSFKSLGDKVKGFP